MKQYLLARTLAATLGIATLSWTAGTQELASSDARQLPSVTVEAQPLGANIERLDQALEYLGAPLPADLRTAVRRAIQARDAKTLQELLDPRVLLCVQINPEARVRVIRGPARRRCSRVGYTPVLVKVVNESGGTARLRIGSPQVGARLRGHVGALRQSGCSSSSSAKTRTSSERTDRFLDLEMFTAPPMTATLSGLRGRVRDGADLFERGGRREATITFDVGQGTQDLGFRAETPMLFTRQAGGRREASRARPRRHGDDGPVSSSTTRKVTCSRRRRSGWRPTCSFRNRSIATTAKRCCCRLASLTMFYGRGPEYRWMKRDSDDRRGTRARHGWSTQQPEITVRLERWIDPSAHGFLQRRPSHPRGRLRALHVADRGRGSVGDVPPDQRRGSEYRQRADVGPGLRSPETVLRRLRQTAAASHSPLMKYDIEVSGFGSEALGHVCPAQPEGSDLPGRERQQGMADMDAAGAALDEGAGRRSAGTPIRAAVSKSIPCRRDRTAARATRHQQGWQARSGRSGARAVAAAIREIDTDHDGVLGEAELRASHDRADDQLPNLAIPELNSVGAQEIFVTAAHGAADFISAMDTDRIREWNAWYHLLNSGIGLKGQRRD